MTTLLDLERKNNNLFDRLKRAEFLIAEIQQIIGTKLFHQVVPGDEGFLGNRAYSTAWLSLGWPPANVEKLHVYDGNLKVEGNGFEDVTGGTIYLQNKPSLKGASPADNDVAGLIRALAINDAGNPIIIADMYFQCTDVTEGSEDGAVRIVTQKDYNDAFVFNLVRDRMGINELDPVATAHISGDLFVDAAGLVAAFGNGTGSSQVTFNGAAGQVRDFIYSSGGSSRWILRVDGTSESGSNAGSDFVINRRSDAGSSLGNAVSIRRSDGAVQVGSPTGGYKGSGTINAQAVYDDNTLLTDWLFDLYYDGRMRAEDAEKHPGARIWSIPETAAFAQQNRHLPTMPGRAEWEANGSKSVGQLVTALWETVEQQQLQIIELHERLEALENGK